MRILNNVGKPCQQPFIKGLISLAYILEKMFLEFKTASIRGWLYGEPAPKIERPFRCPPWIEVDAVVAPSTFAVKPHISHVFLFAIFRLKKFVGVIVEETLLSSTTPKAVLPDREESQTFRR